MTAIVKFSDGSVVEDTYMSESDESDISELYTWIRILKNRQANLRYEIRDACRASDEYSDDYTLSEDSDIVRYHEYLKNVTLNGEPVGAVQAAATNFTGDDYFSNHNLGNAIDTATANPTETKIATRMSKELSNRDKRVQKHFGVPTVPLTPEKEEMPLYVASNDRNEGLHTFDEAEAMWEDFLGHIDVEVDVSEPEESTTDDEQDDEPESDSDDDGLLRGADGVGPDVSEKIRNHIVEERVTVDWRNHIDAESDGWNESVVTQDVAEERVQALYGEIPAGVFTVAVDEVEAGNIEKAMTLIADFE